MPRLTDEQRAANKLRIVAAQRLAALESWKKIATPDELELVEPAIKRMATTIEKMPRHRPTRDGNLKPLK